MASDTHDIYIYLKIIAIEFHSGRVTDYLKVRTLSETISVYIV